MKIGIEATRLNTVGRGIDRYTCELCRGLDAVHEANEYVLFSGDPGIKSKLGLSDRFTVEDPRRRFRMIRRAGVSWLGKMAFRDFDLFHFPNSDVWYSKYCKTVVTIHDLAPLHFPDHFFRSQAESDTYQRFIKYVRKNADRILTVSDYSRQDIIASIGVPPEKVVTVYNGVSTRFQRMPAPDETLETARRGLHLPDKFILYVGGLDFRKNIGNLIRAFDLYRKKHNIRDIKLVIAGKTPGEYTKYYPDLKGLCKELCINEEVIFLESFDDTALVALYNLASVFVFPSIFEGFGLPPVEAMRCGCPVICSDRCSLPEVVGDAALMFNPEDVELLADLIGRVMDSEELRQELSAKGLKRALRYSWDTAAQETVEVYKRVTRDETR